MEIKRRRLSSSVPGVDYPSNVADPNARNAIAMVQDQVATLGIQAGNTGEVSDSQPRDNTVADLQARLLALEEKVAGLKLDGRQKIVVKNAGPGADGDGSYYIGNTSYQRYDQVFAPFSVVEIIGRVHDIYLVTAPTESNLPPWKLAFISESGLGLCGTIGFAYPAVSGFNRARVKSRINLDRNELEEIPFMARLGTLRDCDFLDGSQQQGWLSGEDENGDMTFGGYNLYEGHAGFVCLSSGPCKRLGSEEIIHLYDVVFEYQTLPGMDVNEYGKSMLPRLPKHGVRDVLMMEELQNDNVVQVWRAVAGMPEYTPTQLLTNQDGVPMDQVNPWEDLGGW